MRSMKKAVLLACFALSPMYLMEGAVAAGEGGNDAITVVSREDGSGTRSAFVELFGVLDDKKKDATTLSAEITNNTAVMMTSIAGDKNAIGYISLGSLNDSVKALRIDGVESTIANVNNGSYKISRPFLIATKSDLGASAKDFIDFISSREGQKIVASSGYIQVADAGAFKGGKVSGRVIVAGSSSVTPLMEKLVEAYVKLNANAKIEIQQSDSSTGMNAAISGICDIGMASREIRDSEIQKGLKGTLIAKDGIAVIVNKGNAVGGLSKNQVKRIFVGEITKWSKLD
ncbi:MAG: substrate-binding domain-containing protein [Candidatus Accumulibacter sp.]|nr:substrate-binding domain-containing protein [Accumulibacter sp.]